MLSLEALHGKVSAAHMGAFMTNAINGLELFEVREVSLNEQDAGAFVKALIDVPAPTQLLCVSEHLTPTQWMDTWSRITGVVGRVEELPAEASLEKDPIGFKASVLETGLFVRDFGFTGGDMLNFDARRGEFHETCKLGPEYIYLK